ncbi:hypothetical protein Pcinc_022896 [Petrolisthes cinctipes]|uniref:Uncharacterized protein n=1 Tax=Petrolisthes cinctipes TaxID=88211 RepID=A0AAE1FE74_PETCI|nr:hypothetical protein Pcinc_022896 [Petrolisthes cinctipes]
MLAILPSSTQHNPNPRLGSPLLFALQRLHPSSPPLQHLPTPLPTSLYPSPILSQPLYPSPNDSTSPLHLSNASQLHSQPLYPSPNLSQPLYLSPNPSPLLLSQCLSIPLPTPLYPSPNPSTTAITDVVVA